MSFLAAASLALREEKTDQGGEVSSSSGGGSSRVLAWAGDRLLPRQAAEAAGTLLVSVSLQGMLHAEKGGALLATVAGAAAGILLGLAFLILALRCGLLALCHACAATASLFGISHASECAHVSSSNAALWIIVPLEVAGTCLYLALSMSDSHPFPGCSRLLQQLRHTDRGTLARFLLHLNIRGLLFAACILLTAFAVNLALVACTWLVLPAAH